MSQAFEIELKRCFKVGYKGKAKAVRSAKAMSRRAHGVGNPKMNAYECPYCEPNTWHLATERRPPKDTKQ